MVRWYDSINWFGLGLVVTFLISLRWNSLLPFVGWLVGTAIAFIEHELFRKRHVAKGCEIQ